MLCDQEVSLYSPQALSHRHHRSLLVQFILFETIQAYEAANGGRFEDVLASHPRFFPYDWTITTGHLNKIIEHSRLLKMSFPDEKKKVKHFEKTLSKVFGLLSKAKETKKKLSKEQYEQLLQQLYHSLEPLMEVCKESENLLFFLLKNRQVLDTLKGEGYLFEFIHKIYSQTLETLGEKMCDQYHQRGFFSQIPEFKLLLTDLLHA